MSWIPKPSSPLAALRDLAAFMRQRSREQVVGAILAVFATAFIILEFVLDSKMGLAPPPRIVEVELYSSNRTDAEIIADQKKDQAELEALKKQKREQFQKLEKQLGIE